MNICILVRMDWSMSMWAGIGVFNVISCISIYKISYISQPRILVTIVLRTYMALNIVSTRCSATIHIYL